MINKFIVCMSLTVCLTGCLAPDPSAEQRYRDNESILAQDLETGNSIPMEQRQSNQLEQERYRIKNSNPMNNYNILKRGQ